MGCFEATDVGTSLSKIKIIADHYNKVIFSDEKQLCFSKQAQGVNLVIINYRDTCSVISTASPVGFSGLIAGDLIQNSNTNDFDLYAYS